MKSCSRILFHIYLNFWYVPLLMFLIGIKVCLVSFLVSSIHPEQVIQKSERLSMSHVFRNSSKSSIIRHPRKLRRPTTPKISVELLQEWDTLANLKNARIRPTHENRTDKNSIWLIFNRVPRCGATAMVELLETLAQKNGFSHQQHEYRTPWPRFLLEQEQESLVTWFEYQHLPKSYDRYFYFVNFTRYQKFTKEKPIYINLLRDPVQRIYSEFNARRADKQLAEIEIRRRDELLLGSGKTWYTMTFEDCVLNDDEECQYERGSLDFTLSVPFFCGQYNSCVAINDKWGLQMAKLTIERYYSVVGVLERMDQTLNVLENYVPKFFAGVTQLYQQQGDGGKQHFDRNPNQGFPVSEKVRRVLERKLQSEVDLYHFVVQRLALQQAHLSGSRKNLAI